MGIELIIILSIVFQIYRCGIKAALRAIKLGSYLCRITEEIMHRSD